MTHRTGSWRSVAPALLPLATAALATVIFAAQAMTSEKLTAALFYVLVVLLAACFCNARGLVLVGAGCVGLTLLAFFLPGLTDTDAGNVGLKASISGAVIGLTTLLVTQHHRATDALRQSEEQWREVFEHNPVMYFMVNSTGTVLSVNGFGASQLGYTASELVGQSVLNVFFEEDRELVKAELASCAEKLGRSHSWEIRKIRKDGTVLWVRENAKAVGRSANDVIILIACEDITERKNNEQRRTAHFAVTRILAESDSVSREGTFRFHEGRIGHVWQSASPLWMVDATVEPGFVRRSAAAKSGLCGGVIFPIQLETEALGVVEF